MLKKNKKWISSLVIILSLLIIVCSCNNNEEEIIFNYGTLNDIDGNTYKTIQIGSQTWMAENLKTTKYNDSTEIYLIADWRSWSSLNIPGYCWYKNDAITNKEIYGALYNGFAMSTGKLCPMGWHVPSQDEWFTLINYLGGENIAGGKMKEAGTEYWRSPNTDANNESGFSALPSGARSNYDGKFLNLGEQGSWWSTTLIEDTLAAYCTTINYNLAGAYISGAPYFPTGIGVRCVRD
jgi:uncharacterized protein (TIGR02145 family)